MVYCNAEGKELFLITSKPLRDWYFLYEIQEDGKCKKLGKAKTPPELEEKFGVNEQITEQKTERKARKKKVTPD